MTRADRIRHCLEQNIIFESLEIINDSHEHAGHQGSPDTGESHYTLVIESKDLRVLTLVKAHRAIYKALDEEFQKGLHALSIKII